MTVSYDAYLMQQLVAACQTANDEIVKAQQQILAVKSHADWTCKEKSVIDELMEDCKKLINRMQEDENGFLTVLKQVEGELDNAEKSISNLFQGVESVLSKILSIPAAQSVAIGAGLIGAGGIAGGVNSNTVGTGGWAGNSIQSIVEIFQDIGSEITDSDNIWHGPGQIDFPDMDLPTVNDVWETVSDVVTSSEIPICRMSDIQL